MRKAREAGVVGKDDDGVDVDVKLRRTRRLPSVKEVFAIEWYVPSQTRTTGGLVPPAGWTWTEVHTAATCAFATERSRAPVAAETASAARTPLMGRRRRRASSEEAPDVAVVASEKVGEKRFAFI